MAEAVVARYSQTPVVAYDNKKPAARQSRVAG